MKKHTHCKKESKAYKIKKERKKAPMIYIRCFLSASREWKERERKEGLLQKELPILQLYKIYIYLCVCVCLYACMYI